DVAERLALAGLCGHHKHLYAAAARLYTGAFTVDPTAAEDLRAGHRYNAACFAALAGCGKGNDAAQLDDAERARWRQQALAWLRADLTLHSKQLEGAKSLKVRMEVQRTLRHWQRDPDLAGLRDESALSQVPEVEPEAWRHFWGEVQRLLDRAEA